MERGEECSHLALLTTALLQRTQEDGSTQSLGEMAEQLRNRCEDGLSQQVHRPLRNTQESPSAFSPTVVDITPFSNTIMTGERHLYLVLEHSAHPKRELVSRNCQTPQTCHMTVSGPSCMIDTALLDGAVTFLLS